MKKSIQFIMVIAIMIFWSSYCRAQEFLGLGAYYDTGNVSVSWSLGEMSINTISNSQYELSQGFQQSSQLSILSVADLSEDSQAISIYPNPTEDHFFFAKRVGELNTHQDLRYELINTNGQVVSQGKSNQPIIRILTDSLQSGVYFVRLISENTILNRKVIIQKNH